MAEDCLYKQETFELIGLTYKVFNRLGFGYQEKYYQRAYAEELRSAKKNYIRERKCVIVYNGKKIGRYFIDFVVGNIVVELKIANDAYLQHVQQVLGYLKATGRPLGIIVVMTPHGVKIKRVINSTTISAKSVQ